MPKTISLAAYLLKVRDVREREDETLSEIDGETDLLDYLNEQLGAMRETKHNEQHQQVLSVTRLTKSNRTLLGLMEEGEYGAETNIYSVPKQTVVYRRKRDDADLWPYFFRFDIPEGVDVGLLILQRSGNYGIRKVLHRFLRESFANDHEDLRLHLDPIVDPEQVHKYERGLVQEVRFVKVSLPADLADRYDTGNRQAKGRMELVIKAQRGSALPLRKLIATLLQKRERSGVFAIDEGNFEYNDVRVKARVDGTSRTFSIGDPKLRSYYDITSAVKIERGGHPSFESMNEAASELAERLLSKLF